MTLQELLQSRNIVSVVIIDDAYDEAPKSSDIDDESWEIFFADAGGDEAKLIEIFPAYDTTDATELKHSDAFVVALWEGRATLKAELMESLFGSYELATKSDRSFLTDLENALKAYGLQIVRMGRRTVAGANEAQLIIADLFLGAPQGAEDANHSIQLVKELMRGREQAPPPVILMSRSELLDDKKSEFRDKAKLLGALFRVYKKQELLEGDNLSRALERLATHLEDAVRMATFLVRYEKSLAAASGRLFETVRRLDLSDYGQIREVLLNFEGQPLGSYLLDVFDAAFQHEIEADLPTIEAAEALKSIRPAAYPAPHIAGSSNLQDLMNRTIWQNRQRLAVQTTTRNLGVGFGDVLIRKDYPNAIPKGEIEIRDAFVIMTPACDLVREDGARRILLLAGTVAPLTHASWSYKGTLRTPIGIMKDDTRIFFSWDSSDLRLLLPNEIKSMLGNAGKYEVFQRLRDSQALELQQNLLGQMGRVGVAAKMPATFAVEVSASYFHATEGLKGLVLPILSRDGGVCYVGRDSTGGENTRLVLTEASIDELMTAVLAIDEDSLARKSKEPMARLRGSGALATRLQEGLPAGKSGAGYSPIKIEFVKADGSKDEGPIGQLGRNAKGLPNENFGGLILTLTHIDDIAPQEPAAAVIEPDVALNSTKPESVPASSKDNGNTVPKSVDG